MSLLVSFTVVSRRQTIATTRNYRMFSSWSIGVLLGGDVWPSMAHSLLRASDSSERDRIKVKWGEIVVTRGQYVNLVDLWRHTPPKK